ncbi:hypothetical protein CH289_18935 [Rhodococcus sp. RS1C4]|uniref:hypothetical protein n=1 Tax=Rhodococcus sp. 114MFTsu3.1 TaxID=1172184 RepID=UPI00036EE394|nr:MULTISPECIES: hypothetical protein [unclassified Rhodococcus (in: high G+C Gram-positive bacteria)]OZC48469.1 hypothetical protein CH289_18935 [Rhodococcus sp. RS1C4]
MGLRLGGSIGPLFGSVRLGVPREAKSLGRGILGLMGTAGFAVLIVFVLFSSLISWVTGIPVELVMSILAWIIGIAVAAALITGAVMLASHLRRQIRTLPRGRARREVQTQAWFAATFVYGFAVWGVSVVIAGLFSIDASTVALMVVRMTLIGLTGYWVGLIVRWVKRRNNHPASTSWNAGHSHEPLPAADETPSLGSRLSAINEAAREERDFMRHQRRSRKALQQRVREDRKAGRFVPAFAAEATALPLTSLRNYRRMSDQERQAVRLQYEIR